MYYSVCQISGLFFSPFFRSDEISFSVCCWSSWLSTTALVAGARWFFWSEDLGPEVVDLPFFSDFVDGRQQILVQDSTGTSPVDVPQRHVPAAGLFIDSQSLVGDDAFSDLAMMEARHIFRHSSRRRLS